jgi:serine/threonine protein kinase
MTRCTRSLLILIGALLAAGIGVCLAAEKARAIWRSPGWGLACLSILLAAAVAFGLALKSKSRPEQTGASPPLSPSIPPSLPTPMPAARPPAEKRRAEPHLAQRADVEAFFLELYRAQAGAAREAEAQLAVVAEEERQWQYRLRLFHQGQWRERRMTIGSLGDGSGSKSQCFYVIFDTHLVVKIPPKPISDLSDYLRRLDNEARIAGRVHGRPCVVPNLTAILSRLKRFDDASEVDGPHLEARYRQWLEADPSRQRFLKIGRAFAFFMDLSRHQFLGEVLRQSVRKPGRLAAVAEEDAALLDDCSAFEQKYGGEAASVCLDLRNLYGVFDARARQTLSEVAPTEVMTEIEKRRWLLKRAAGVAGPMEERIRPAAAQALAAIADAVFSQRRQSVDAYRRLARNEAQLRTLRQAKAPMAALSANMLDLLDWLGRHRVAMRDLKPDNLLVAGDPAQYPYFLSDSGRFVIGLIDVETAVIFPSTPGATCPQPQLGGTPAYATPSHFVPNALLQEVYGEPARILQLQDWYATVGIIFEIVAGTRLFDRTGRLLTQWIREVRGRSTGAAVTRVDYEDFNSRFWQLARSEFRARVVAADPWLKAVSVPMPEGLQGELRAQLERRGVLMRRRIDAMTAAGDFVGDSRQCQALARHTADSLERLLAGCQEEAAPRGDRLATLLRQQLVPLRKAQERIEAATKALASPGARISVRTLLAILFEAVAGDMQTSPGGATEEVLTKTRYEPIQSTEAAMVQCTHSLFE